MEFFIISDGVLLDRIAEMLARKVKEGVTVRIIYDDMGCKKTLSHKMKSKLLKAGVNLTAYNRIVPLFNVALNYRDHRKIIVIDGKTAYTGGSNLADEYVNEKRMYGYWKDTGIRLDGEGVDGFTLAVFKTVGIYQRQGRTLFSVPQPVRQIRKRMRSRTVYRRARL